MRIMLLISLLGLSYGAPVAPSNSTNAEEKAFGTSVDTLMHTLAGELTSMPERSRTAFTECMNQEMRVERLVFCLEIAKMTKEETTSTAPTTTSTTEKTKPTVNPKDLHKRAHEKKSVEEKRNKDEMDKIQQLRQQFRQQMKFMKESNKKKKTDVVVNSDEEDNEVVVAVPHTNHPVSSTTTAPSTTTTKIQKPRYRIRSQKTMTSLSERRKKVSPVATMSDLILSFVRPKSANNNGESIVEEYNKVAQKTMKNEDNSEEKAHGVHFFDVKLGSGEDTVDKLNGADLPLTNETYTLLNGLAKSDSKKEHKEYELLSPQIGSILPRNKKTKRILSPTLFAMYEDSKEDQILSIPKVLDDLGLVGRDKDKVMEVALELAGARSVLHKKDNKNTEFRV